MLAITLKINEEVVQIGEGIFIIVKKLNDHQTRSTIAIHAPKELKITRHMLSELMEKGLLPEKKEKK